MILSQVTTLPILIDRFPEKPVVRRSLHVVVRHRDCLDDAVPGRHVRVLDEPEGGGEEEEVLHVAAGPRVRVRGRQGQVLVVVHACEKEANVDVRVAIQW